MELCSSDKDEKGVFGGELGMEVAGGGGRLGGKGERVRGLDTEGWMRH